MKTQVFLLVVGLTGLFLLVYYNSGRNYDIYSPVILNPRPLPYFRYGVTATSEAKRSGAAPVTTTTTTTNTAAAAGHEPWWREVVCKRSGRWDEESGAPLSQLLRNVTPEEDNNVFLVDTACNSRPKYRVWCSVESWARQNPNLQVWFLLTSGGLVEAELPKLLLQEYTNLHVVDADLDDLFRDTPLVPLFTSRKWTLENTWPVELLSDMLRVLVLWRWGGVYSDTDVLCIRPFTLPLNSLGFETNHQIGSAFYSFHAHNPLLLDLMKDMNKNFKLNVWGSIGPGAISRVVKKTCMKDLQELWERTPAVCPGNLTLYPRKTFYPIPYPSYRKFFNPRGGRNFTKMFNDTFTLHFWNKMSKKTNVKVNSDSIYEVAAKNFCPLTFQSATAYSDVF